MAKTKRTIIQTIHGVHVPPRKKFKPQRCLVLRFVIPGTIPSKKNNYVAEKNWKKLNKLMTEQLNKVVTVEFIQKVMAVKPYIRTSERFKKWEDGIKGIITEQAAKWAKSYERHNLVFPISKCSISVYHYWEENRRRDNSNKAETVHDLFVKMGIIVDDQHQCLRKTDEEADVYANEILDHITVITVCAYDW